MVVIMPIGLILILTLIIYRLNKEKEQEKELYYHREMEKLRKEVEKYYILAGEEEKDYSGQVLQHINDAYTDKKGAADANTIIEG